MKVFLNIIFIWFEILSLCHGNPSISNETIDTNQGMWSKLLEEYTLSKTHRSPKVMSVSSNSNRYIPTSEHYITKRIGEAMELEPHLRPPGKVILTQQQNLNYLYNRPTSSSNYNPSGVVPHREVTETDLYLLGAIEKLVFRVDFLENRLKRVEQMIYYMMAGNNQKEMRESCATNFTRVGDNCYYISNDKQSNWKTSNNACKKMNAHLAEFENLSEMEDIIAFLLNHPEHRGRDFWLGGLNPGLLWIWANSAKPVNPNTNLTNVATSASAVATNTTAKIPDKKNDTKINQTEETKILNTSANEIKGSGRCLRLSYNPAKHSYQYYGQECTSRQFYICEYEDKSLENQITKIARDLKL